MSDNITNKELQGTEQNMLFTRVIYGMREIIRTKWKGIFLLLLIPVVYGFVFIHDFVLNLCTNLPFFTLYRYVVLILFGVLISTTVIYVLAWIGTPLISKSVRQNLERIGFMNSKNESPILLARYKKKGKNDIVIWEFENRGISRQEWEAKQIKIETVLNLHIVKIEHGKSSRKTVLHTVSNKRVLPQKIYWHDNFLQKQSFVLVLGESLNGKETVNLLNTPHILLGGSTGSGKSKLLKLLLMQCVKKGAEVYIADFKGGVDFPPVWHEKCTLITYEKALLELLEHLTTVLQERKELLRDSGCSNIDEYNAASASFLQRIILGCDEVAEVLDKTGLAKEEKELVQKIESRLSVIARQGRAFGIHLILATQRPDANILSGQIRNNIDCRICGKADSVLSQIILDNSSASEQIPKDAQGLFITYTGMVFRGYLFDERKAFER